MKAFIALAAAAGLAACASSGADRARSGFLIMQPAFLGRVVSSEESSLIVTSTQMPLGVQSKIIRFEVLGPPDTTAPETMVSVYDTYGLCDVSPVYEGAQLVFVAPVSRTALEDQPLEVYACIKVDADTAYNLLLREDLLTTMR